MKKTGKNTILFHRILFWIFIFFLYPLLISAEDIQVTSSIDAEKIGLDDTVVYTVTFKGIGNPPQPDLSRVKDFKILQSSRSSEFQMINGSTSSYIHFNFFLMPLRKGILEIPSLQYSYKGKSYSTMKFRISVVDGSVKHESKRGTNDPFSGFDDDFPSFFSKKSVKPSEIDIKLKTNVSKRNVFKGEQLIFIVDLYARNKVESVNMLSQQSFPGFWQEWSPVKESIDSRIEYLDNKKYNVYEIRKVALFATETGIIKIPSLRFEIGLGGNAFSLFSTSRRVIRSTREIKIDVKDVPEAGRGLPVGNFRFSVSSSGREVNINDFFTVNLSIEGSGNVKTIDIPEFQSGNFYKVFPSKVTRKMNFSENGLRGHIKSEIPFSFKKTGRILIPSLSFSFFDPSKEIVETIKSHPIQVDVVGKKENSENIITLTENNVEKTGEDIDFIKSGKIFDQENFLYKKKIYRFLLIIPFFITFSIIFYLFILNRYIFESDLFLKQRRLKNIQKRLRDTSDFGMIHKIIEDYFAENTKMNKSGLTHENIREFLFKLNLTKSDVGKFMKTLKDSESYKFSPLKRSELDLKKEIEILNEILKKIHGKLK